MRKARLILIASILAISGMALGVVTPVLASCSTNNITLYVNANGGGSGAQSFCPEAAGNQPNLNNIDGPCSQFMHADSWNDCVSSVRVTVAATQCIATYSNANYSSLMTKYWGSIGPNTLFNVSPDNAMSSFKQYSKTPTTPAGNC